ncbi:hypothetical protein LZ30DRAFT_696630 [Colletotrichum cereale]|nr:hypothetical protein LZ30DRAFT_696630 [Colletotrichum cereale]
MVIISWLLTRQVGRTGRSRKCCRQWSATCGSGPVEDSLRCPVSAIRGLSGEFVPRVAALASSVAQNAH